VTAGQQIALLVRALEGGASFDGPWVVGDEASEALALRAVERFLGERAKSEVLFDALYWHAVKTKAPRTDEIASRHVVYSAAAADLRRRDRARLRSARRAGRSA
jgi:hypothetical protein